MTGYRSVRRSLSVFALRDDMFRCAPLLHFLRDFDPEKLEALAQNAAR
jgi:hypothetical protein